MDRIDPSRYLIRIVDDDEGLLKSIGFSLRIDGWQVKTYLSACDFLEEETFEKPGCVILDVQMPEMTGPQLHEELIETGCSLPVIFLTAHASVNLTIQAFRRGACDFLLKPVDPEELHATILKAIEQDEKQRELSRQNSPKIRFDTLTDREKQISKLIALGLPSSTIGTRLGRSRRTIERHRANILKKLGLHTPEELSDFLRQL